MFQKVGGKSTHKTDTAKSVRAALLLRDESLSSWSAKNGCKRQNLTKALVGEWRGPRASALVRKVVVACGLDA